MTSEVLVEVHELRKSFSRQGRLPFFGKADVIHAVDGVNLELRQGETLGLVGESGSGKSTLGRVILNLTPASSGKVIFEGRDVTSAQGSEFRRLRRRMQIVFQDPYASLNPRMSIGDTIREGLRASGITRSEQREKRLLELVDAVGLGKNHIDVFPHQLSGGQRQRVAIARALSVSPTFIVADEPVSALDLSIQAQILNLLADLQAQFGLTYLLISHDLNVIRYLSDRVVVMYQGRIVEQASASALFEDPRHPYTQLLFSALPKLRVDAEKRPPNDKLEPSHVSPVSTAGCAFAPRCPRVSDICRASAPALENWNADHRVACFKEAGVNQNEF